MRYYVKDTQFNGFVTDRNAWARNTFKDVRGYRTEATAKACRTRMLNLNQSPWLEHELEVVAQRRQA